MTLVGSRKWSIAVLATLCGFVLALLGKLTTEFVALQSIVVGAFHVGNAIETRTKAQNTSNGIADGV